jgi:PIN domain nuclease of toxin-antitoxin system
VRPDRLLLDSHVLLWWAEDNPRLPASVAASIWNADTVLVSIATAWEIAIKVALGKLRAPMSVAEMLDEAGFDLLPVTLDHTVEVGRLPLHHRDPFDRMLIAQARVERLRLITHDRQLRAYDIPILWD